MKNLTILFLLLATPAQAEPLTLICKGKNGDIDMVPGVAILDLDKLTFKPPWLGVISSINGVTDTEIWFRFKDEMIYVYGTLDRVSGRVAYSTYWPDASPDTSSQVGVCKPAKPLF